MADSSIPANALNFEHSCKGWSDPVFQSGKPRLFSYSQLSRGCSLKRINDENPKGCPSSALLHWPRELASVAIWCDAVYVNRSTLQNPVYHSCSVTGNQDRGRSRGFWARPTPDEQGFLSCRSLLEKTAMIRVVRSKGMIFQASQPSRQETHC